MVRAAFLRNGGDPNLQAPPPGVDANDARRGGPRLYVHSDQHRAVEGRMEDLRKFHEPV